MLTTEKYDLALIWAQCWWTKHVQYKALVQNCITVTDHHLIAFFVLLPDSTVPEKRDVMRTVGSHFTDDGK